MYRIVALVSTVLLVASCGVESFTFYVSPDGFDANPGTIEEPFASIQRAQSAVRQALSDNDSRNITVILRGGTYRLERTLEFDLEDSPAPGRFV